jgi:hypothetical protein
MMFAASIGSLGKGSVQPRINQDIVNKPEEGTKIMSPASPFYSDLAKMCN